MAGSARNIGYVWSTNEVQMRCPSAGIPSGRGVADDELKQACSYAMDLTHTISVSGDSSVQSDPYQKMGDAGIEATRPTPFGSRTCVTHLSLLDPHFPSKRAVLPDTCQREAPLKGFTEGV